MTSTFGGNTQGRNLTPATLDWQNFIQIGRDSQQVLERIKNGAEEVEGERQKTFAAKLDAFADKLAELIDQMLWGLQIFRIQLIQ